VNAGNVTDDAARVYVAPHYDDVALSCGGQVALDARTVSPQIVTVFAGQPQTVAGAYARMQHERWGFGEDAVLRRREEDACAACALGAAVRTLWLDELDAIYRNPAYDSGRALFGRPLPDDALVIPRVVAALEALDSAEFVVPLGVGNHVDHQLVFHAGQALARSGLTVWAYADLPYALDEAALAQRLARGGVGARRFVRLDDASWERKLAAISCYASQLPVLFRRHGDYRAALTAQALSVGGDQPGEALWRVLPTGDPWAPAV
jgi:LmbE family N-acetylglucosaminyl deacetylase